MTDALASAIVELEGRRDRMLAEYQQIEEALNALRRIGTDDERVTPPAERPSRRASVAPPPAPSLVHHNRDQERTARILALLATGPLPKRTIAQKLGQDSKVVHLALWRLKQAGHVITIGRGMGTKWAVPAKRPSLGSAPAAGKPATEGP